MRERLPSLIFVLGLLQWSVLVASSLVPLRLDWKSSLAGLPRLVRQLFWIYGSYVVMAIVANGAFSVFCADELAGGSRLGRAVCGYIAIFWGVRLGLQVVLDAKPFLTTWWLRIGYHLLTLLFVTFTVVFGLAALM